MNTQAWAWLAATFVVAGIDWLAVARLGHANDGPWQRVRYVAKPLTMVMLTGVALSLDPATGFETRRGWFVAAILLGMAGDIFLMLPKEELFIGGLVSFFLGHLAYLAGLHSHGPALALVAGVAVVLLALAAVLGRRIIAGAVQGGHPELRVPIAAYIVVLVAMASWAVATGNPLAIAGGLLFMVSDSCLAWNRFVGKVAWAPLTVIVTYHLAQIALVLSLVRA